MAERMMYFRADEELAQQVEEEAKRLKMPMGVFVSLCLRNYFNGITFERKKPSQQEKNEG